MARYIWRIFQHSVIPLSWGICFASVKTLENGTEFHVHGFKMGGYVKIEYNEGSDTFIVTLTPDDNLKNRITIENVYLDNLISVIDENVEYCENYKTKVKTMVKKTSSLILWYSSFYKNYSYRRKTRLQEITFRKTSIFDKCLNT